jgi:hypothetical protein
MDPHLWSNEFRTLQALILPTEHTNYLQAYAANVNRVAPLPPKIAENYTWPHRLEYIEQLFDPLLQDLYIIFPGSLYSTPNLIIGIDVTFEYEKSVMLHYHNPGVFKTNNDGKIKLNIKNWNHPFMQGYISLTKDIFTIENQNTIYSPSITGTGINLLSSPLIFSDTPLSMQSYFCNYDTAYDYQLALDAHLAANAKNISTIHKML